MRVYGPLRRRRPIELRLPAPVRVRPLRAIVSSPQAPIRNPQSAIRNGDGRLFLQLPPGPLSRRFLRWARGDTALVRPARRDTQFARGASIMSVTSSLSFFRGEDVTVDFQMTPPADVTGWSISFTLKDTLGGITQNGFPLSATIVDGPRGRFRVAIAAALTAGLAVGRYVWDARRTDSGNKTTLADGYLDLRQEVTP
jgi:hypothetical protein